MGRAWHVCGKHKCKQVFVVVDLKERGQLECLGVDGGIILICINRKKDGMA
jgi:hypothetical protein